MDGVAVLELSKTDVMDEIKRWARKYPDIEVTGLVARGPRGDRVIPMKNIARDPTKYYEWEAEEMQLVWSLMEAWQEEPVAIYHSHPGGSRQPSERDMEGAMFVGLHYLIVFPMNDGWFISAWECLEPTILVGTGIYEVQP